MDFRRVIVVLLIVVGLALVFGMGWKAGPSLWFSFRSRSGTGQTAVEIGMGTTQ